MSDIESIRYQVQVQHKESTMITPGGEEFFKWGDEPHNYVEVSESSESLRSIEFVVDGESFWFRTPNTDEYGTPEDPRIDENMYAQEETNITKEIKRQRSYTKSMTRFIGVQ